VIYFFGEKKKPTRVFEGFSEKKKKREREKVFQEKFLVLTFWKPSLTVGRLRAFSREDPRV